VDTLLQSVVTGLLLGGLYALIGVGMSLIFGIMKITNIAHGDLMILSTFITMTLAMKLTGSVLLALLLSIAVMIFVGILIQKFLINKVIDKGAEPALLVCFGLSIIIQNSLLLGFGPNSQTIPTTLVNTNILHTNHLSVSGQYALNFLVAVFVIVALSLVMKKTPLGRAIRAASSDVVAAEIMGVNTKRMYIYAMCLTMAATCVAGLLVGQTFVFYPSSGTQYLIIAFGVVVIGGMGSIFGTLIGGIILGLSQLLGANFLGTPYQILTGYVVMLIILTLRPQGLLSKKARK
jgi:branched-chain amino acid transport system permease protein